MISKITLKRALDNSVPTFATSDGEVYRGKPPVYRPMVNEKGDILGIVKAEKGIPFVNLSKLKRKGVA